MLGFPNVSVISVVIPPPKKEVPSMRCNKCHIPMKGSTAYDGACECGGLIEATPPERS